MPETSKADEELITATEAGRRIGKQRNTVMQRIARQRYDSKVVGGVTFVVVNDALKSDIAAAEAEKAAAAETAAA